MITVGRNEMLRLDKNVQLGQGSRGFVFKGCIKSAIPTIADIPVAIKRIQNTGNEESNKKFIEEITTLQELRHDNIIQYRSSDLDDNFFYIALDFCDGTLLNLFSKKNMDLVIPQMYDSDNFKKVSFKIKLLNDIAKGLNYLHSDYSDKLKYIHGDLTPQNVLLKKMKNSQDPYEMRAIISDFGLTKKLDEDRSSKTLTTLHAGTRGWRPQELLGLNVDEQDHLLIRTSADIFAFGCLVQFVLSPSRDDKLVHPFGESYSRDASIKKDKRRSHLYDEPSNDNSVNPNYDYLLGDILVDLCINSDPSHRPTTSEILIHPLFWNNKARMAFVTEIKNTYRGTPEIEDMELQWNEVNFDQEDYIPVIFPELWYKYFKEKNWKDEGSKLFFLMTLIRNIQQHYGEHKKVLENVLGDGGSDKFVRYFFGRVPPAFPVIYIAFYNREGFGEYYHMEAEHCDIKREIAKKTIMNISYSTSSRSKLDITDIKLYGKINIFSGTYEGNLDVAIKRINNMQQMSAIKEIDMLKTFNHTNIIRYIYSEYCESSFRIAMELCAGTMLELLDEDNTDVIFTTNSNSDENVLSKIQLLKDVAEGLHYLHSKNIIHGDLAPHNVLIKKRTVEEEVYKLQAVMSNFGSSIELKEGVVGVPLPTSYRGTHGWKAPELLGVAIKQILLGVAIKTITTFADIFAFGCLVHFTLSSNRDEAFVHPFGAARDRTEHVSLGKRVAYLYGSPLKRNEPRCNYLLGDILVDLCVNSEPSERLTTSEIVKHPLFWDSERRVTFISKSYSLCKSHRAYFDSSLTLTGHWDANHDKLYHLVEIIQDIKKLFDANECGDQALHNEQALDNEQCIKELHNFVPLEFPAIYLSFYNGEALQEFDGLDEYFHLNAENCSIKRMISWNTLATFNFFYNYKLSFDPNDTLYGRDNMFKGIYCEGNIDVAIKRVLLGDTQLSKENVQKEIHLLKTLNHANIIQYIYSEVYNNYINIALDLYHYTVADLLENTNLISNSPGANLFKIKLTEKIAEGLNYLHTESETKKIVIHGDLTTKNILLKFTKRNSDDNGYEIDPNNMKVVISNFGSSVSLERSTSDLKVPRSNEENQQPTTSTDVFSFGSCIVNYMWQFQQPELGCEPNGTFYCAVNRDGRCDYILAHMLADQCVNDEPSHRLTAHQILKHPLFWDYEMKMQFIKEIFKQFNRGNRYLNALDIKNMEERWDQLIFDRQKYIDNVIAPYWNAVNGAKPLGGSKDTLFFLIRFILRVNFKISSDEAQKIIKGIFDGVPSAFPLIYVSFSNVDEFKHFYCNDAASVEDNIAKFEDAWKSILINHNSIPYGTIIGSSPREIIEQWEIDN